MPLPSNSVQIETGRFTLGLTEEIETVRQLLPKIANGRKTRYSKLRQKSPVPGKPKKKK